MSFEQRVPPTQQGFLKLLPQQLGSIQHGAAGEYRQSQTLYTWSMLPRYVGSKAEGRFRVIPAVYDGSDTGPFCRFQLVEVFSAAWIMTLVTVLDDATALQSFPATSFTVGHGGC